MKYFGQLDGWLWDGSKPGDEAMEVILSGAASVKSNDADGNQLMSVSRLGRLRWLWIDLNPKIDSTNLTW